MVLVARAASPALSPVVGTSRYAPGSQSAAPFEPNPIDATSQEAQIHDQTVSYRFDDVGRRQDPRQTSKRGVQQQPVPRPTFSNLVTTTSSEEFATSFGIDATSSGSLAGDFLPVRSTAVGIGTYETNARVIHGRVPPKGETLNITL